MKLYYHCLVSGIFNIIYRITAGIQIYILKTSTNLKSCYIFLLSSVFYGHLRQKLGLILKFTPYQSCEVLHKISKQSNCLISAQQYKCCKLIMKIIYL